MQNELHISTAHYEKDGSLLEPRFWPFDGIIKTRPNVAVVEMLLREKKRVQKLDDLLQRANGSVRQCTIDSNSVVIIPRTVLQLQPQQGQDYNLLPYWIARSELLDVDSLSIHNSDINPIISRTIQHCRSFVMSETNYAISTDVALHCVGYHLGGMQLSTSVLLPQVRSLINDIFSLIQSSSTSSTSHDNYRLGGGTCNSKLGYAVLSNLLTPDNQLRKSSSISSYISSLFAALPPNHPAAICGPPFHSVLGVSPYNKANQELGFQSTFANKLQSSISHALSSSQLNNTQPLWGLATFPCSFDGGDLVAPSCCNQVTVSVLGALDEANIVNLLQQSEGGDGPNHHLLFTVLDANASNPVPSPTVSVTIDESRPTKASTVRHQKESILAKLSGCNPGWFCNRCLQVPIFGSFSKCTSFCGKCVADAICNKRGHTTQKEVTINVQAAGLSQHKQKRIPRIIHQTWFEDITMEKYPQLYRLQNTWRASGWEYKFYTDDSARDYIQANFPDRFASVFDSLLPGAYKADFFRYLVLYKEGGIYVDVDVMLDTNLDSFIASDLAFFAPVDAVGSYADEHFCVWNGFLGSAPAHPILTNVIEWMVNLVSNRGDMYDMERAVCNFSGMDKIENWKVRAEPSLLLSGPCALGLAVNNALGNEPLSKFRTGLIRRVGFNKREHTPAASVNNDLVGDIMILVVRFSDGSLVVQILFLLCLLFLFAQADKQDLGAFRFSDPERNIVVATTDMVRICFMYDDVVCLPNTQINVLPRITSGEPIKVTYDV